ncbi:hypothetical protein GQ600_20130 [Phytophthora cactorum]|nr:hypothetical protein GQ600_20130 [Phytophthora cactorum]
MKTVKYIRVMDDISPDKKAIILLYGTYPIWVYLKKFLNIDLVDVWGTVAKEEPILTTMHGTKIVARVVSEPTDVLGPIFNNDVIFLLNSIYYVFDTLKRCVERDGEKILKNYKFKLDRSTDQLRLVDVRTEEPVSELQIAVMKL